MSRHPSHRPAAEQTHGRYLKSCRHRTRAGPPRIQSRRRPTAGRVVAAGVRGESLAPPVASPGDPGRARSRSVVSSRETAGRRTGTRRWRAQGGLAQGYAGLRPALWGFAPSPPRVWCLAPAACIGMVEICGQWGRARLREDPGKWQSPRLPHQVAVLVVLRPGYRDALVGRLGRHVGRLAAGLGASDARPEPDPQPPVQGDLQGCGGANERCCREGPVCRGALTCRDTFCREG